MVVFMYIVASQVNILEVVPLFFLGSTLIFIGYDLMFEWLWEIRHQTFWTEYAIIWLTFFAIQVIGINAGIFLGIIVAMIEQVVLSAQTTVVNRISKRSRAIWAPDESRILGAQAYHQDHPKIATLELIGAVFFGSAQHLLDRICDEIGIVATSEPSPYMKTPKTPHTSSFLLAENMSPRRRQLQTSKVGLRWRPKFLVLDMVQVSNIDTSASRGCFTQLVRLCTKQGILVCVAGASQRATWMFRSHKVAHSLEEEDRVKARLQSRQTVEQRNDKDNDHLLLFLTVHEALEFCETVLLHQMKPSLRGGMIQPRFASRDENTLHCVLSRMLDLSDEDEEVLEGFKDSRFHDEISLERGQVLFDKDTHSDSFYIVLRGAVANRTGSGRSATQSKDMVISGAGPIARRQYGSSSNLIDPELLGSPTTSHRGTGVATIWSAGGIFGYVDYVMERPRTFRAMATQNGTKVAKVTRTHANSMQTNEPELFVLLQRSLLHASILDLSNCTCHDV